MNSISPSTATPTSTSTPSLTSTPTPSTAVAVAAAVAAAAATAAATASATSTTPQQQQQESAQIRAGPAPVISTGAVRVGRASPSCSHVLYPALQPPRVLDVTLEQRFEHPSVGFREEGMALNPHHQAPTRHAPGWSPICGQYESAAVDIPAQFNLSRVSESFMRERACPPSRAPCPPSQGKSAAPSEEPRGVCVHLRVHLAPEDDGCEEGSHPRYGARRIFTDPPIVCSTPTPPWRQQGPAPTTRRSWTMDRNQECIRASRGVATHSGAPSLGEGSREREAFAAPPTAQRRIALSFTLYLYPYRGWVGVRGRGGSPLAAHPSTTHPCPDRVQGRQTQWHFRGGHELSAPAVSTGHMHKN